MPARAGGRSTTRMGAARAALVLLILASGAPVSAGEDASAVPAAPEAAARRVFLWKISPDEGSAATLYVLGSTHAGRAPLEGVDRAIEQAFAAADALAVEVDTSQTTSAEISSYAREIGAIHDGTPLRARLPGDMSVQLVHALEGQGMTADALDTYEPWLASLALSGQALSRLGYDASFGVEEYFLQRARDKRVLELEGARSQLDVLDGLSDGVQHVMLGGTLRDLDGMSDKIAAFVSSWEAGDAERMDALVFADAQGRGEPGNADFFERVYFARNRAMVAKLASSLAGDSVVFAVIGAGHLVGAQGIPALFAARGYHVQQVLALSEPIPQPTPGSASMRGYAVLR
jgi:uncharacterized protein